MVDLVGVARRFIRDQMQERDDILGAYVGGSAARGGATEVSDVDVTLVVEAVGKDRVEIGGWDQGTYIDAGFKPREALSSMDRVMEDHVGATILRDALIVHDPTGFLTDLQTEVRAVFMEPARVQARVNYGLDTAKPHVAELGDASATEDPLAIALAHTCGRSCGGPSSCRCSALVWRRARRGSWPNWERSTRSCGTGS